MIGIRRLRILGHQHRRAAGDKGILLHVIVFEIITDLQLRGKFIIDEDKCIVFVGNHPHRILLLAFETANIELPSPAWDRRFHFEKLIAIRNIFRNLRAAMANEKTDWLCRCDERSCKVAFSLWVRTAVYHIRLALLQLYTKRLSCPLASARIGS